MNKVFNIKFLLLFIAFAGLVGFSFSKGFGAGNKVKVGEVIVEYNQKGEFYPARVVVKKGTKVTFVNKSGQSFWPASDFYPLNSNYPGFDPKKIITSGGEWAFVFDETGSWGYHDNLKPINKGVVIVVESSGVYIPIKDKCDDLQAISYSQRQVCWYNEIKLAVKKGGVKNALDLFKKLYSQEPLFSQACHDVMHLIGDEAYREHRKGKKFEFAEETAYCGYGFYHGFIEAMLYTTNDFNEVRNFCESANSNLKINIESPNAIYSCYHGIGHATFDAHKPELWGDERKMVSPAIKTCEEVASGYEAEKAKQCVTGVFNALGIAYANDLYNFKLNPKDPVWYCRTLETTYKRACFIEVAMSWISTQMGNYDYKFADGATFIQGLKDADGEDAAIFSLSSDYTRLHINDLSNSQLLSLCRSVKSILFDSCIQGVNLALLNWGKPSEEYARAIDFCKEDGFSDSERNSCFAYIFSSLPTMYPKDKRVNICNNYVEDVRKQNCINSGSI